MTTRTMPAAVCLALFVALAACATNPVTGKKEVSLISEAEEIAIGQQGDAQIRAEMGVYDDPELQRYVADIGSRLAQLSHRPNLPWSFTVVDHPAVNAFALPGGYIYITRGILPYLDDEAELAGVLGHEIAHVTARHAAQQTTRAGLGSIGLAVLGIFVPATQPFGDVASMGLGVAFMKFDRDDERESDRLGMEYAARGNWDPKAIPDFLDTLARLDAVSERGVPNWLSTHPEPASRVVEAQPIAAKLTSAGVNRNRDGYREQIEGITVGDNPEDGIVRDNAFVHPVLRFAVEFPEGWDVLNTPSQVAAQEPGQPYFMMLQLVDRPQGSTIGEIALRSMNSARFRHSGGQLETVNGLQAYVGQYQGSIAGVGTVTMRAAHIEQGRRQVYMLAGFAPRDQFSRIEAMVEKTIRSFRPLSSAEADRVQPNRLSFYTVRQGDTWQSIAARHGALIRARDLAIMNNYAINEQPKVGETIKVVVAG